FPGRPRLPLLSGRARFRRCVSPSGANASGVRPQRRAHAIPRDSSVVERDSMTRKTLAFALIGSLVAAAATATALPARRSLAMARDARERAKLPRVRVQVLNATKTRGLGRRA